MVSAGSGAEPPAGVQGAEPPVRVRGRSPPEADEVFVFKTLIFNASATVLHQLIWAIVWVANLMLHIFVFNVARPAFNNTHFV